MHDSAEKVGGFNFPLYGFGLYRGSLCSCVLRVAFYNLLMSFPRVFVCPRYAFVLRQRRRRRRARERAQQVPLANVPGTA